jgi:hypothetical protein
MTRAELMRHALSQALRRVHIGAKRLKIDEETRWQIAGEVVEGLANTVNGSGSTRRRRCARWHRARARTTSARP